MMYSQLFVHAISTVIARLTYNRNFQLCETFFLENSHSGCIHFSNMTIIDIQLETFQKLEEKCLDWISFCCVLFLKNEILKVTFLVTD